MKTIKFLLLSFLSFISISVIAHEITDTIKVNGGNCAACKEQIEQTVKIDGVTKAEWSSKTHLLIVSYNTHKVKNDEMQKKLADAGYDTEKYAATDEAYNKLDNCCKYRSKAKTKSKMKHSHSS
jgi:Cation transport ATPase